MCELPWIPPQQCVGLKVVTELHIYMFHYTFPDILKFLTIIVFAGERIDQQNIAII